MNPVQSIAPPRAPWGYASPQLLVAAIAVAALFRVPPLAAGLPQQPCLRYHPTVVTLEGTVARRPYRESRNNPSVRRGDRPDTAFILGLATPICVAPDSSSDDADRVTESGVREVQLAIGSDTLWAALRGARGPRLRITGELFHASPERQRARVLFWVIRVE